jgi:hypothetical protein
MKATPTTDSSSFTEQVMRMITKSSMRMAKISNRINAYDQLPRWRKYILGGRLYRAFWLEQYAAELDSYMVQDLKLKDS